METHGTRGVASGGDHAVAEQCLVTVLEENVGWRELLHIARNAETRQSLQADLPVKQPCIPGAYGDLHVRIASPQLRYRHDVVEVAMREVDGLK